MPNLFLEHNVWKRGSDTTVVLYKCLQNLDDRKFAVQSADFYSVPLDDAEILRSTKQFFELFAEIDPVERCQWFDSIEQAISAHERDFC